MIASKRLYFFLVLAVIPFTLTHISPPCHILGVLIDLAIVVLVVIDFELTQRPSYLIATRIVQERFSIGRANTVSLKVGNTGKASLKMRLKDDYPLMLEADISEFEFVLPPNSTSVVEYELTPGKRGAYEFGNITIRYLSQLGLFWRQIKIESPQQVKVFPDLKKLYDLSIKLAQSTELGELHQRKRGQGTDFASLREYTVGDDAKAIDWKATARRDRPVVRTFEAEQEQRLLILIDAGRMMLSDLEGMTRFDHALNAALCLSLTGLSHNDQVGLGIFADQPLLYLPPRRGKSYMKKMLESTHAIEPRMIEPDYIGMLSYFATAQKGRALIVVVTDLTDPIGSQSLLTGLAKLSGRHLPFCVTLKDRQVIDVARKITTGNQLTDREILERTYRRAIATDLLNQRELALSVLQRRGCLILDCPPQHLSDSLVDAYLEIKARARL
ncbi:MAG: DUF58 domain-containing protein [Candidatus Obscuribacterales bacterium]|nr:DUF58 domain-containing protein [Candidatus Obscuribacterales bacterium]